MAPLRNEQANHCHPGGVVYRKRKDKVARSKNGLKEVKLPPIPAEVKTWESYCDFIGIPPSTANEWLNRWFGEKDQKGVLATLHTGDQESYTPTEYIESARKVMGSIDVDPASNEFANETVKAKKYYTTEDDGLAKEWKGKVWLNPPYNQPAIKQFIDKLLDEYLKGNVELAI